jgi:hypothetical protein
MPYPPREVRPAAGRRPRGAPSDGERSPLAWELERGHRGTVARVVRAGERRVDLIAATVAGWPTALVVMRPVSHPQHTISDVALLGRAQGPLPGDVSLAQHGMLFWDERPACRRRCLEVLRHPLEKRITKIQSSARH